MNDRNARIFPLFPDTGGECLPKAFRPTVLASLRVTASVIRPSVEPKATSAAPSIRRGRQDATTPTRAGAREAGAAAARAAVAVVAAKVGAEVGPPPGRRLRRRGESREATE